jgi:hypothetical protein
MIFFVLIVILSASVLTGGCVYPDVHSFDFVLPADEVFVPAGTLLGTQGNYSGDAGNPVGVHLHFSIVQDEGGKFRNELDIQNTLDPSPYFQLRLNARENPDELVLCSD